MDLERLPSFRALLVNRAIIVTIFWGDEIYASFMGFFWCHVIYWHVIRCSLRNRSEVVATLFIQDKALTLGCQTRPLHGNNESVRNSVQPCTFLQIERSVVLMRNIKISEGPNKKRNMSCVKYVVRPLPSLMTGWHICLISKKRKKENESCSFYAQNVLMMPLTTCACFLYVCVNGLNHYQQC